MKQVRIPKNKKEIARPKKEWVEFGFGLGRMRDASWARDEEQIIQSAKALVTTVRDRAQILESTPDDARRQYWYMLQSLKKILEVEEIAMLDDLFNLGVSVPEIFSWDRMHKPTSKKKVKKKS